MNQYKVGIIGAGSIGANKPDNVDYPGSGNILTHANAVQRHPKTELTTIIDIDDGQLAKAKVKWQPLITIDSYSMFLMSNKVPDIVIVAVPTGLHYKVFNEIFLHPMKPKLIIAEKPFCSNSNQARSITESYNDQKIPIAVDYIRRFTNGFKEIKRQIDNSDFGKALNCRVLYTRGLRHEGCHAIDLMRYFFGKCIEWETLQSRHIQDRDPNDPSLQAKGEFKKCEDVIFQPCDGRKYGIFEVDICFENCRLRFIDNGLYVERYPINEENEWGHKSLDYSLSNVLRTETGLNTALYGLIDNAVNFLDGKEDLLCTAQDAIAVHRVLEGVE